jgi:phage protein D
LAAASSTISSGLPPTDYYAPNFKIEVEGKEIDQDLKGDVLDLKVVMDIDNMTSFDFTVNNWDDKLLDFKYSDTGQYDVGNRVLVYMGYADRLVSMVRGQITTLSPKFPETGSPTMAVSGLDGMYKLKDSKPAEGGEKYVNMSDWEIAEVVAKRNNLKIKKTEEGQKYDLVVQKNQDDAQFLMERAKRIDFDCYIKLEGDVETLFFVKPTDARDGSKVRVFTFGWGTNLISFNPTLTLSNQVTSVTVRGWDAANKAVVSYKATSKDLPGAKGNGTNGPEAVEQAASNKQEVVIDAPVTSEEEAKKLAISLLTERAYEFITGSGQVIGLPDMRPGDILDLKDLGQRFKGEYYVKKVEHTLGEKGYLTNFDVRKLYDGGKK